MSRPSAIWLNNNNWLDVFAQGSDGHLWQIYCHSGSSCTTGPNWSAWIDLGLYNASLAGPTVAGYVGNGVRLDIFIRGSDQYLYEKTWQTGSLWGNWRLAGSTPGGVLGSDPAAAWWSSNQWLDVFVGGADGHVWQYYFRGSAWAWNDNGLWPGSASSAGRIAAGAPLR